MIVRYDQTTKKLTWDNVPGTVSYLVFLSKEGGAQNVPVKISPDEEATRTAKLEITEAGNHTVTIVANKKDGDKMVEIDKGSVDITIPTTSRLVATRDWLAKKWPVIIIIFVAIAIFSAIVFAMVRESMSYYDAKRRLTTPPPASNVVTGAVTGNVPDTEQLSAEVEELRQILNDLMYLQTMTNTQALPVTSSATATQVVSVPVVLPRLLVTNSMDTNTMLVSTVLSGGSVGSGTIDYGHNSGVIVNGNNNTVNIYGADNGNNLAGGPEVKTAPAVWPQDFESTRTVKLDDCFVQSDLVNKFDIKTVILAGEDISVPIPQGFGVSFYSPASADQLQIALDGEIRNPYPGNTTPVNRYPNLQKNEYRFRLKDGVPSAELELTFYRH